MAPVSAQPGSALVRRAKSDQLWWRFAAAKQWPSSPAMILEAQSPRSGPGSRRSNWVRCRAPDGISRCRPRQRNIPYASPLDQPLLGRSICASGGLNRVILLGHRQTHPSVIVPSVPINPADAGCPVQNQRAGDVRRSQIVRRERLGFGPADFRIPQGLVPGTVFPHQFPHIRNDRHHRFRGLRKNVEMIPNDIRVLPAAVLQEVPQRLGSTGGGRWR